MEALHNIDKIYVFSPSRKATGGIELLHQLVDYLRKKKKEAYIYYYEEPCAPIPKEYAQYDIATVSQAEDSSHNIIVLPEICFHLSKKYQKAQIVLWWLSVDNYYYKEKRHIPLSEIFSFSPVYGWKQVWHRFAGLFLLRWKFKADFSIKKTIRKGYIHAYQSEYARIHLAKRGVINLYPLKDYINTDFTTTHSAQSRKSVILYNPKKGIEFTRKLIKAAPDLTFIPLEHLSREELQRLFATSMLYIDFGSHPGMDRLSREAAANGCCILTGKKGAAANDVDIPIEAAYKLDEKTIPVRNIVSRMRNILAHYDTHCPHFEAYRQMIGRQEEEFHQQIDTLFLSEAD